MVLLSKKHKFLRAGELRTQANKNCHDYLRMGGKKGREEIKEVMEGGVAEAG